MPDEGDCSRVLGWGDGKAVELTTSALTLVALACGAARETGATPGQVESAVDAPGPSAAILASRLEAMWAWMTTPGSADVPLEFSGWFDEEGRVR